jgi:pimeloyl-ACP methyl ester carboxylesterase
VARDPRVRIHARLVSPVSPPVDAAVLLAHDGPEFERVAGLSRLFPHDHVALLSPGSRSEWYSANPAYAAALVHDVLPTLPPGPVVGLGASLGALALLHAETRYPGSFAGLFLQSGSFFTAELDPQEAGFPWFRRILAFVGRAHPVGARVVLTCGRDEENLLNNREMAGRLGVPLLEVPGGHSMLTWRDALDPHLHRLLQEVKDDRRNTVRDDADTHGAAAASG